MSWLYAQTWLWYLIAFVIGVLLAWAFLVVPQQRRLRAPGSGATGRDVDAGGRRDAAADDRGDDAGSRAQAAGLAAAGAGAAASGTALFHSEPATDPGPRAVTVDRDDPVTEQLPAVDPALSNLDTTELPVQSRSDDTSTAEIPIVPAGEPATPVAGGPEDEHAADGVDGSVNGAASPGSDAPEATPGSSDMTSGDPGAPASGGDGGRSDAGSAGALGAAGAAGVAAAASGSESDSSTQPATDSASPEAVTTDSATTDAAATDSAAGSAEPGPTPPPEPATGTAEPAGPDPDPEPTDPVPEERPQGLLGAAAAAAGAAFTAGAYPGSARPAADGAAPSPEFTIKGNEDSMLFHTPDSPYYGRTRAEVWFTTAEDAEAAGFTSWTRKN